MEEELFVRYLPVCSEIYKFEEKVVCVDSFSKCWIIQTQMTSLYNEMLKEIPEFISDVRIFEVACSQIQLSDEKVKKVSMECISNLSQYINLDSVMSVTFAETIISLLKYSHETFPEFRTKEFDDSLSLIFPLLSENYGTRGSELSECILEITEFNLKNSKSNLFKVHKIHTYLVRKSFVFCIQS
jgi:hypothetical protein